MNYKLPIILFDPECPLCLRFKQGLHILDKNLTFVSAREDEVYGVFPQLSKQDCLDKIHMITEERKVISGPEVVDYLIHRLPAISKLAWLLDNDQGKKVKDFFYQKVEELKELSTKKDDCNQCPKN